MISILIVEDDDIIRDNLVRLLALEGYHAISASDGRLGLQRARQARPDIVITDVGMPQMDGFALVESIRADPELASASVLLLTGLADCSSMRRGMTAGADDYLAKPFTSDELLEALRALLRKKGRVERSIWSAVQVRDEQIRRAWAGSAGASPVQDSSPQAEPVADETVQATVLFSDIRGFTSLAERLASGEVAELLTGYIERACQPVLANGGGHLKFIGDGLMALFSDTQVPDLPAARRAVSAALGMVLAAHDFRAWLGRRFPQHGLPPFAIGVGLHAGEVTLCRLGEAFGQETAAIGDTVNVAARLEAASKELGWTVVASSAVLQHAGAGIQTGGMTSLALRGKNGFVDVAEITGLRPGTEDDGHGMSVLGQRTGDVRDAVRVNSELTAGGATGTLRSRLSAIKAQRFGAGEAPLRLLGYRLERKLGAGGMTEVYLAVREKDGLPVVLKVLDASGRAGEHLSRFIHEYRLLSAIEHPHVVRIYDHGFADGYAFIAMEYFELGDLRSEIGKGRPGTARVLDVISQVAHALAAVHALGVIHRDLKPANIMRRSDGSVALADFGIARSMLHPDPPGVTQEGQPGTLGTPYYLSPEQAAGGEVTPQSDLYSLGVMLYEMLAGNRPYGGDSLHMLLARHQSAPTPRLPSQHAPWQPLIDKLMAKQPRQRYLSAAALLADLDPRRLLPGVTGAPRAARG